VKRRVVLTAAARDDAHLIDDWWRANRQAAAGLFVEELTAALALLEVAPEMGRPYRHQIVPGLRRVLLRSTRHHVYYVTVDDTVRVLAIWSAMRGRRPSLVGR
jgi:plasmid stabilization system protein ParE